MMFSLLERKGAKTPAQLLTIYVSCLFVLGALDAMGNVFAVLIPIIDQLTWPGIVISFGLFFIVGAGNIFDHTVAFEVCSLIVNAALFTSVIYLVLKVGRIALRRRT